MCNSQYVFVLIRPIIIKKAGVYKKAPPYLRTKFIKGGLSYNWPAAGGKFLQVIRGNLAQFPSEIVGNQRQIDAEQRKRPKIFACGGRKQRKSIKTLD